MGASSVRSAWYDQLPASTARSPVCQLSPRIPPMNASIHKSWYAQPIRTRSAWQVTINPRCGASSVVCSRSPGQQSASHSITSIISLNPSLQQAVDTCELQRISIDQLNTSRDVESSRLGLISQQVRT
jgi:hypothetical protein